ncbi:tyrosine-type recombinase/integrase [Mycobacteroides abscessus]|uniref:tyrosine-type recombinase/integrase n=1 Tax=unclassified Desemzia TaxID=2685243 RepID=UPI0009A5FA32|nr:prophage integrase [Mycobacteroides abscessus subsp. abscessus]
MKLPNGYGSVTKLSGNRRRPFFVRKTIGWNEKGHPIYLPIGYTETKEDGLIMLAEYNKNPYDVKQNKVTLAELFEKLKTTKRYIKFAKSTKNILNTSFGKAESLHDVAYSEIKTYHMQEIVDESGGYSSQSSTKSFFKNIDKLAMELDVIGKMYSDLVIVDPEAPKEKVPFTEQEIDMLWELSDNIWIKHTLAMIYTGFRISEYVGLKKEDVDLVKGTLQGGLKTVNGRDRIVPIHHRIFPFIETQMKTPTEYLNPHDDKDMSTQVLRNHFKEELEYLGMKHIPHETRHTLRTRLDSKNANKVSIDLIMGHKSKGVGERVYTHKTLEELKETIELMR